MIYNTEHLRFEGYGEIPGEEIRKGWFYRIDEKTMVAKITYGGKTVNFNITDIVDREKVELWKFIESNFVKEIRKNKIRRILK